MKSRLSGVVIIVLAMIGLALNGVPSRVLDVHTVVPAHRTVITSTIAPRNVILFTGDGMGAEHIRAAGMYQPGGAGTLVMESFPYSTTMTPYSADSAVTDSAAGATAIATGHKVANMVKPRQNVPMSQRSNVLTS